MKRAHLWLSIPSGVIIFIICITGAILVFEREILETLHHDRYFVTQTDGQIADMDSLVSRVNEQLGADTITALKIYGDRSRTIQASLASAAKSYVYIDPYTAEITGFYNARQGFFHKMMTLHRWLMLPERAVGRIIVGISTIFMLIILITGIARWFRNRRFTIRRKTNFARKLFDLHRVPGLYAAPILILSALTGLMWSFGWYRSTVASIFAIETTAQSKKKSIAATDDVWQRAFEAVDDGYRSILIEKKGNVALLPIDAVHERATHLFSTQDGQLTPISYYGENRNQSYMMGWAYVIHTGGWGGLAVKLLTFFAALTGASLPVMGYILYVRRQQRLKPRRVPKEQS